MKMSEVFKSKYLRADDLKGRAIKAEIESVTLEEMADDKEEKPVIYFKGKDRGLVLNRTNNAMLVSRFGDESDQWKGHTVQLTTEPVNFQGRMVDGIRVKVPTATPVQDFEDDIPF